MSDTDMYALAFRSVQGYRMCAVDDPCPCGTSPMTYDGPQSDCLLHGDSPEMSALLDVVAWDEHLSHKDGMSPVFEPSRHLLRSDVLLAEVWDTCGCPVRPL